MHRTEKTPETDPTPTPPSIPAEASLLTPPAVSNRRPPLQAKANLHRKPATWHQHDDLSPWPVPSKRGHSRFATGQSLTPLPTCTHVQGTDRQTPKHPFQPRCRLIQKSQPLTNMPSAEFSAWGVTRPQERSSYRAAPPAGRYIGNLTVICYTNKLNSTPTPKIAMLPLSLSSLPMMVGPNPHVQTGDPTFLIPIPSLRQVMHHTTIDHPNPLMLTPFPPQVLQIPTLIESLAPSGDAESQSGVWGSPA
jgi:hypothetical protein